MLITVEFVFVEGTVVAVHLVITFVVNTFEEVWIRFVFWGFKSWRVYLEVGFTILSYISVVSNFIWPIVF